MNLFFLFRILCVYKRRQRWNGNYIETAIVVSVELIELFCVQFEKPRKIQTPHILIVFNVCLSYIVIIIVVVVINVSYMHIAPRLARWTQSWNRWVWRSRRHSGRDRTSARTGQPSTGFLLGCMPLNDNWRGGVITRIKVMIGHKFWSDKYNGTGLKIILYTPYDSRHEPTSFLI